MCVCNYEHTNERTIKIIHIQCTLCTCTVHHHHNIILTSTYPHNGQLLLLSRFWCRSLVSDTDECCSTGLRKVRMPIMHHHSQCQSNVVRILPSEDDTGHERSCRSAHVNVHSRYSCYLCIFYYMRRISTIFYYHIYRFVIINNENKVLIMQMRLFFSMAGFSLMGRLVYLNTGIF